jgi:uncharacterized protein
VNQLGSLLLGLRRSAGLSQRALARRAGTSQPAVARYEKGSSTPSWETLQRLAESCGRRLRIDVETVPEAEDVELAERLLELTPVERLRALSRYAHLHALVR